MGITTCFRAITTNPVAEVAQLTVMYLRDLASTLSLHLSVSDLLGCIEGQGPSVNVPHILNGDNLLFSNMLRVLALMSTKAMSLAVSLGKMLSMLVLITHTTGNVF